MTSPARARRGAAPLALLTALAAVPAVLLAGTWQYADSQVPAPTTTTTTTAPPAVTSQLATDLLSWRRRPAPLAERAAAEQLEALEAERSEQLVSHVGESSCVRVVAGDTALAESGPGIAVIPASNQKLFVAAVALHVLGGGYRFRTEVQSAPPVAGVVEGNVYLIGGGDPVLRTAGVPDPLRYPSFNTTALEPLADQLVELGVTTINGDIVGDGSRYDDEFRVDAWGDAVTNVDAGPYDALLVNDGLISAENYGLEPNRAAARIFFDLLAARGIAITGSAANAARPADATLTTLALIESLPLDDVLVEMLHTSDNNTAEMMLKELGFTAAGQGTRQAGLEVVRTTLASWGVPLDGVELHDGSGLSRDNRATCAALEALVGSVPVAPALRRLLPAAGRDGTLADAFLKSPAEGRMMAKTGTLTDVKALTGTMPAGDGTPIEFALVLNGPGADGAPAYEPVWNALVELIDSYPVVVEPDVARFAPL
jgi:D-alanyl-D-alanine carboxypeptidase/D-alanyl-D-alanine-endopeptidase (penicillin-binding protein 4)